MMSISKQRFVRLAGAAAASFALIAGPTAVVSQTTPTAQADPCVNGVIPWNPYVVNCNLPPRTGPKVRGAAPDAGAIIACRGKPGCLSWYVNGPW
ncbi:MULTISPECIES: hypothetical protein [Mycolicibacterium]|uniref:DUF3761 domain-containing protein n=3 Tax=Mycolicibacterium TaxID=1866885 RepID=A0AAI8XNS5_MYCME|nr:hypothetical protein hbim_03034 [Mycolicibacterium mageritense]GJJ20922.1 hypothetical protein MTY414_45950 [Mycolicibacterium mageritense]